MEERDHYLSKQYHQELLKMAAVERLVRNVEVPSTSRLERMLEKSGDLLISLGTRLKNHNSAPDLSGEYA
jgi:hypothetical protein